MGAFQLVPLNSDTSLTALAAAFASVPDDEFSTGMKPSFGVLRIAGKVFAITKGKERTPIMDPKDPEYPARSVSVVILRTTPGMSKTYYVNPFDPANPAPPDCYSNQGDKPAADARAPQAKSCATCPHNVWGSKVSDNGNKTKACGDSKRVAVANPSNLDEPLLLSIPPDSFKNYEEFVSGLKKHGLKPPSVVVQIGFDQEKIHPCLTFKAIGGVTGEFATAVLAARESDTAIAITGAVRLAEEHGAEEAAPATPAPVAAAPAPAPVAAAPAPAAPAPATAPDPILAGLDSLDIDLGSIDFNPTV